GEGLRSPGDVRFRGTRAPAPDDPSYKPTRRAVGEGARAQLTGQGAAHILGANEAGDVSIAKSVAQFSDSFRSRSADVRFRSGPSRQRDVREKGDRFEGCHCDEVPVAKSAHTGVIRSKG